jgi:hypothetical protein
MGQKTARNVAPDQGPERRGEGDTNAFIISACDPAISWLPLFKVRDANWITVTKLVAHYP